MPPRATSSPPTSSGFGSVILAINWTFAAIAIVVVASRHFVRQKVLHRVRIEDWLIFLTLIFALTLSGLETAAVRHGLGEHTAVLEAEGAEGFAKMEETMKLMLVAMVFAVMAPGIGRISYAILLMSIIPRPHWKKKFLWGIVTLQFISDIVVIITSYSQCQPISSYWKLEEENCWDHSVQQTIGFVQGGYCSLVDLILAVMPATIFWRLKMKLSTKISLSILMGLGIFAMVCAIVKTVMLQTLSDTADQSYARGTLAIWFALEAYTVLIASSIPTLRPLMKHKSGSSNESRSHRMYGMSLPGTEGYQSLVSGGALGPTQGFRNGYYGDQQVSDGASDKEPSHIGTGIPPDAILRSVQMTVATTGPTTQSTVPQQAICRF